MIKEFDKYQQDLIEIALTHLLNTHEEANRKYKSGLKDCLFVQARYMAVVDPEEVVKLLNFIQDED